MEYKFGKSSLKHRGQIRENLVKVVDRALSYGIMDFSLTESVRSKEKQNEYYDEGKSEAKWPKGKHNVENEGDLAMAVDFCPYINNKPSWNKLHCCVLGGLLQAAAAELKIKVRWGGNWDMDGEPITDQDFQDLVHMELVEE